MHLLLLSYWQVKRVASLLVLKFFLLLFCLTEQMSKIQKQNQSCEVLDQLYAGEGCLAVLRNLRTTAPVCDSVDRTVTYFCILKSFGCKVYMYESLEVLLSSWRVRLLHATSICHFNAWCMLTCTFNCWFYLTLGGVSNMWWPIWRAKMLGFWVGGANQLFSEHVLARFWLSKPAVRGGNCQAPNETKLQPGA